MPVKNSGFSHSFYGAVAGYSASAKKQKNGRFSGRFFTL
jgi:hypothetical protein